MMEINIAIVCIAWDYSKAGHIATYKPLKSYSSDYNPAPTLSSNQSLQYYKEYLIECSKIWWQTEIIEVPAG